jgi:alanine dehydrogenase
VNKLASGTTPGNSWRDNQALVRGINVEGGKIVHPALQDMKL